MTGFAARFGAERDRLPDLPKVPDLAGRVASLEAQAADLRGALAWLLQLRESPGGWAEEAEAYGHAEAVLARWGGGS